MPLCVGQLWFAGLIAHDEHCTLLSQAVLDRADVVIKLSDMVLNHQVQLAYVMSCCCPM